MKQRLFISILLTLFIFADCKRPTSPMSDLDAHALFINDAIVSEFSQMQQRKKPVDYNTHSDSDIHEGTSMVVGEDGTLAITVKVRPHKLRGVRPQNHGQSGDSQSEASIVQNMKILKPLSANVPNSFYSNQDIKPQQLQDNTNFRQIQQKEKQQQQLYLQQPQPQKIEQEKSQPQEFKQQYRPQQGTLTEQQLRIQKQQKEINNYLIDIISGFDKQKTSDGQSAHPERQKFTINHQSKFPVNHQSQFPINHQSNFPVRQPQIFPGRHQSKFPIRTGTSKFAGDNRGKIPVWYEPPKAVGNHNKSPIRQEPNKFIEGNNKQNGPTNKTEDYGITHVSTYVGPVEYIYTLSDVAEILSDTVKSIPGNVDALLKNAGRKYRRNLFKIKDTIGAVPIKLRKKLPRVKIIKPKDSILFN